MVSLPYLCCVVTFLQTSDINSQIGEYGLSFDVKIGLYPLISLLRPLSDEMLKYAYADTHFLYVFNNLRNPLLDCAVSRSASPESRAGSPMAPDAFV
jgi:hypothetical protein